MAGCPQCKEVINNSNLHAAEQANLISRFLREVPDAGEDDAAEDDDELYALALDEVNHILAVRRHASAMARKIGAPKRWQELMDKLAGAAYS